MGGGGGSSQSYEASFPFANVAREQWADYQNRFQPEEQKLIHEGLNPIQYDQSAQMAGNNMDTAYQNQQGAMTRDLSRMGVTMTPQQKEAVDQNLSLGRASAAVGAENTARNDVWDRINGVMSGGLSTLDRKIQR